MSKVKKKHFPTVRIEIIPSSSDNPLPQQPEGSQISAPDPQEQEAEKTLAVFFAVADRVVRELESDARKLGELQEDEPFPEHRARELREKIVSGMFEWAVRRMGADLETYLEEGRRNFLDNFMLHYEYFEPKTPHYERFWEPFEKNSILYPP